MTVFIGSYPTSPPGSGDATPLAEELAAETSICGFEIPWNGSDALPRTVQRLRQLRSDWRVVITAIPWTMTALTRDRSMGLASTDEEGRARAVAENRRILDAAHRMRQDGDGAVAGIHIHSAPRGGSGTALSRSLDELAAHQKGTRLILEHTDALTAAHAPAKGFLALDEEIAAARGRPFVGIGINWARSMIEVRDTRMVEEHVTAAQEEGLLSSLFFSGVSDRTTGYGPAWADAHLPIGGPDAPDSLLTREEVSRLAQRTTSTTLLGIKMAHRRTDGTPPSRAATTEMFLGSARFLAASAVQGHR